MIFQNFILKGSAMLIFRKMLSIPEKRIFCSKDQEKWNKHFENKKAYYCSRYSQDGIGILYKEIPKEYVTEDMLKTAISINDLLASYIPKECFTQSLSDFIFLNNGVRSIENIPADLRTEDMRDHVIKEIKKGKLCIGYIKDIPERLLTQEICNDLMEYSITGFRFIPQKFMTEEICHDAVIFDHRMIEYVPVKLITEEMRDRIINKIKVCFAQNKMIRYIPESLLTQEICDDLLVGSISIIQHIPEKFRTQEICNRAIKYHPRFKEFVPENKS